jgi:lysophospholipase L1-like esterase
MAPFRTVTLGDSIPWGQGLLDPEKYDRLLRDKLATVHPEDVTLESVAHSGAVIGAFGATGVPQPGEVPSSRLTILEQCDQFSNTPESVDLVLLDGGINDVGVATILNPLALIPTLSSRTTRACYYGMLVLLRRISAKFSKPSCRILVTGYYSIVSDQSDPLGVEQLLKLHGIALPDFGNPGAPFLDPVIHRCHDFFDQSTISLQQAIADAGDARITFVPTGFTDANAIFVPVTSLLWELDVDNGLSPLDPVAALRHPLCDLAHPGPLEAFDREHCYRASAGHPNVDGASQIAAQLMAALGL